MYLFGSMVLAADAYRRELFSDAARVRSIPTSHDAKDPVPTPFARSRCAIGTMMVGVGQRLQAAHTIGPGGHDPEAAVELGRTF